MRSCLVRKRGRRFPIVRRAWLYHGGNDLNGGFFTFQFVVALLSRINSEYPHIFILSMSHRFIEHTADLMIEVTSSGFEELLRESLQAMMLWTGPEWGAARVARDFAIEASDSSMLLVDFLNEALTLSQIHHEAYDQLELRSTGELSLEGSFTGHSITGARDEIKAVTYHEASVEQLSDGTWKARFLVDI